jgi:hypothetical protein
MKSAFLNHFHGFTFFSLVFLCPVHAGTEVGKVVSLTGKVMARIESKKTASKVRFLKPADPVFQEDVINTDSNGSVKILFSDQSIMDLGNSSLFKVEEFKNQGSPEERRVEMSLSYGKIRAAINQKIGPEGKFKIKTRAATMGVRGTEFYVSTALVDQDSAGGNPGGAESADSMTKTSIVVTEGKVEVATPKGADSKAGFSAPVEVLPGQKFTASLEVPDASAPGRSPASIASVEAVAPDEMKSVVSEGKLPDTTFARAVQIEVPSGSGTASDGKGVSPFAMGGSETLAVIQEAVLSKPEVLNPATPAGGFQVPGGPAIQPAFSGNFLPGFITTPLVKLNIIIRGN